MKILCLLIAMLVFAAALAGCSSLPSMQMCDTVTYHREGLNVTIHAECRAPINNSLPGL